MIQSTMHAQRFKKRFAAIVAVLIFSVLGVLAGPYPGVFAHSQSSPIYRDGGYVATSDATERGYVLVVVFIENGRIEDVRISEMDGNGNPKPDTYPWEPFHQAIEQLPSQFAKANSAQVDAFTGATGTTEKASQAVERALLKAEGSLTGTYLDGTFFGRSPADDHGYGTALVTVQDDQIIGVRLGEVNADGSVKDYEVYPHEITVRGKDTMENRIVEKGDTDVDGITGATGSSIKWLAAVNHALKTARIDQ